MEAFPVFLLLFISSIILLWLKEILFSFLEDTFYVLSLHILSFVLWSSMWVCEMEKVSRHVLEKDVILSVVEWNVLYTFVAAAAAAKSLQ